MSHTKGELEVFANSFGQRILVRAKGKGFNVAYCGDDYDGFSLQEQEANAERLALCWNSHDRLLAACKDLIDANEYARKVSLREESPRGMVWGEVRSRLDAAKLNAKAAITEAEKE